MFLNQNQVFQSSNAGCAESEFLEERQYLNREHRSNRGKWQTRMQEKLQKSDMEKFVFVPGDDECNGISPEQTAPSSTRPIYHNHNILGPLTHCSLIKNPLLLASSPIGLSKTSSKLATSAAASQSTRRAILPSFHHGEPIRHGRRLRALQQL